MIKTWDELELPVLRALADLEDRGSLAVNDGLVAAAVGLAADRGALALRRLLQASFITATELREGTGGPPRFLDIELAERGLRAAGAWPTC